MSRLRRVGRYIVEMIFTGPLQINAIK